MKAVRLIAVLVSGAASLAVFSGCETQRSACEREKRLTERMDELQMDIDSKIMGMNAEMANIRNTPVIVQQPTEYSVAPTPTPVDQISIEDTYPSKREQLEAIAQIAREDIVYQPASAPRRAASGNHIRVPVPARTIQAALKEAGFYNGAIDGKIGRQSVAAITAFQREQGIKADGIVGRVTWQHLQPFVPAGMTQTRLK